jgi:putative peptidoglycan lipid II flippase
MRVLFERGAFTAIDTKATSSMLAALAPGLPAYVLIKVLHPSFFAREDTKTPMVYAGISLAANVILSLMLFLFIGATGLALATAIAGWINVALLVAELTRRDSFALDHLFRRRFAGIIAACMVMGGVLFILVRVLNQGFSPERGLFVQGTSLLVLVGTGLATYLGAAHLFGAAHFRDLIKDAGR